MDNPTVTDDVFNFATELVENDSLKVADKEKELLKNRSNLRNNIA